MGLRDTLRSAVGTAFTAIGDVPENAEFICRASAHDPDTATATVQEISYAIRLVVTKYTKEELASSADVGPGGKIRSTDFKGILQQETLPVKPTTNDVVEWKQANDSVETRFQIIDVNQDPVGLIWILQLRAN